ncbi:MAG: hypothetical protein WCR20_10000, partial [Verrucomicrobiota bacterium]
MQPLRAQLDKRLWQASGNYFSVLDMYQQSQNLIMKPEVVTLFDFTGSTAAVMPHKDFAVVNVDKTETTSSQGMVFTWSGSSAANYNVTVALNSGVSLTSGIMLRPDGTKLTAALIDANYTTTTGLPGESASPKSSDVRNWIRCASHVRFTGGTSARTFDLPICWTILDDPSVTPNAAAGQYRKMYSTYPLKMTIINPASNTEIEMDTCYRVMSNTQGDDGGMYSSTTVTSSGVMTACTFNNHNSYTTNYVGWKSDYLKWIFNTSTTIPVSGASGGGGVCFKNGIPGRTRYQAIKDGAMRTWAAYYNKVFWAYRFLKYFKPNTMANSKEYDFINSSNYLSNDSQHDNSTGDPTTTPVYAAAQRSWVLLDPKVGSTNDSDIGLRRLAAVIPGGGTALSSGLASTYAQLNDPNCIFNDIEVGANAPVECRKTYVMLFTDGIPTDDPSPNTSNATPYLTTATAGSALAGNTYFFGNTNANIANINPGNNYFNIINLAALAANGGDTVNGGMAVGAAAPAYPTTTETYPSPSGTKKVSEWIPFWIKQRGSTVFARAHYITTMTVGVSLAGAITDATSPKYRLFVAAAVGDPMRDTWDLSTCVPFATDSTGLPVNGAIYFFDATNPDLLSKSLNDAFYSATANSNVNSTTDPNLPYVGASFGHQVYLGKFQPPAKGGTIWPGDLYMFPTQETTNNNTTILNKSGNPTTTMDATTAGWSASNALFNYRNWSSRTLYTRIPGSALVPEPGLSAFTDIDSVANSNAFSAIKSYVDAGSSLAPNVLPSPAITDAQKKIDIQYLSGGDIYGTLDAVTGRPLNNRKDIMGDVINSSPAVLEYTWSDPSISAIVAAHPKLAAVSGNRFRLVVVGTNQGWLHAFGEVTKVKTVTNASGKPQEIVTGDIDELWSFMPTDFLPFINYLTASGTNAHRLLVDGSPVLYHLDLPPSAGGSGNGTVDCATEKALVIFGLGGGGRSYYALDIHDPSKPAMKWSLVPDEAAIFPTSRIASGVPSSFKTSTLPNAGFSTCTPGIGRVMLNGVYRDAVFLGGGMSYSDVDTTFGAKLGRSVMALDVWTGQVLSAVDMSSISGMGPIPAGLVPFEFMLNSGMAQRAYFTDFNGSLWCWGSRTRCNTAGSVGYRIDSSDMNDWSSSVRKVAQDMSGANNAV